MGLLSLSNLAIYIKKGRIFWFKSLKMISNDPKFNLGQLNAYKLMFAIKLSMKKRIKEILAAWFTRD